MFVEDEELQSAVFEFHHLLKMSRQLEQESFTLRLETWLSASWRRDISILNAYFALSLNFDLGISYMIGYLSKSWRIQQLVVELSLSCYKAVAKQLLSSCKLLPICCQGLPSCCQAVTKQLLRCQQALSLFL